MSEWFMAHPWMTFILAIGALECVYQLVQTPFRVFNRRVRHQNISARGWPPAHLDADGDSIKADE